MNTPLVTPWVDSVPPAESTLMKLCAEEGLSPYQWSNGPHDVYSAHKHSYDPQEQLAVLEAQLNNASQVIVDIYSRYLFEKEVLERREQAELSSDDFNDIMERAQKAT